MDGREKIAAYNGRERTMGWKENATREREREREYGVNSSIADPGTSAQ